MNDEEIFHEALARAPADRAAYLDRACAGDPAVRASFKRRLDASHAPEGKLQFQALLRSDQAMLLPAIAALGGIEIGSDFIVERDPQLRMPQWPRCET